MSDRVTVSYDGRLAIVSLNHPDRLNLIGGVPIDLVAVLTRRVESATGIKQRLWISRVDCIQKELTTLLKLMGQPDPGFPILSD